MNCEFSTPKNYLGETPGEGEFWQFSEIACENSRFELLALPDEEYLYFDKTISPTDILLVSFILIIFLSMIFSFVFRLVYPYYFRYINKRFKERH